MKKVFITFVFLATLSLSMIEYARAAEVIKIYPTDDAIAQLYDDDGFTDWNGARNYQGLVFREPFTSGITNNVGNINVRSDKFHAGFYRIYRVSKTFDLSDLPEDAVITDATLGLFKTVANTHGDISVVVTSHEREDIARMQKQDWNIDNFGTESFAEEALIDNTHTMFDFNTSGIEYLNRKRGEVATIGLLTSYDFYDTEPSVQVLAAGWHEIEKEGIELDPYLEIEYEIVRKNINREIFKELVVEATEGHKKALQKLLLRRTEKLFNLIEDDKKKRAFLELRVFAILLRVSHVQSEALDTAMREIRETLRSE